MQDHVPRQLAVGFTPMEHRREVVLRLAMRAEELGYSTVYVAEGWGYDASVLLAEVALRTSRIRLGTGVLNVWGRSAASIAMLASSLADLSGGRFELGLGAGSPPLAEGLHDVPFRAPVARLGQVTRQVRRLLDGERIVPSGLGGSRPLRLAQPTPQVVPIQMAALRPRAVRLCGELADGWLPFLLPASGLEVGRRLLQEGASAAHRPLPRVCPCLPAAVSPDPAEAGDMAWWWISFYLSGMGPLYGLALRDLGFGDAVEAVLEAHTHRAKDVPERARALVDELVLWGDDASARARLESWYRVGAEMPVIVLPPNHGLDELEHVLEVFAPAAPNAQDPNPEFGFGSMPCPETSQGAPGRIRTCPPASGGRCPTSASASSGTL